MAEDDPVDAEKALGPLKWAVPAADLGDPVNLQDLLIGLQLLGTDKQRTIAAKSGWNDGTPGSIQVIKSGATEITRRWAKLTRRIAGAGGVTAILGTAAGTITDIRTTLGEPLIVALVAGGALVTAAALLSAALLIAGDLEARGIATAARNSGRAEVTAAFLTGTAALPGQVKAKAMAAELTAAMATGRPVTVQCRGLPDSQPLTSLSRLPDGGLQVDLGGNLSKPIDDVIGYRIDAPTPAAGPPAAGEKVGRVLFRRR
ncbi:hypothetical protein [Paractinoplanes durhamensis]|uniref:Uncharacterized protein n=1 Tax=Paractinoplanes durhamensis TaxID=113563 RepID=A0ABQ3YWK9_9ACTN|nr:hypothetical protein [Actinoplanes durhamensis]GIE01985.1 hypothetical protein Adu01nite_33350 [Actinoplanes durhamensis]